MVSNLKAVMREKGVTILDLATRTKLAKKTIERARGPMIKECRLSTLEAIAAALGVQVSDLYTPPSCPPPVEQAGEN